MFSLSQIKEYYPPQLQSFERFILREYLQYKILEIIYDGPYASRLIFLGGTALRILYNNDRFSEDLDFDNMGLKESEFEQITNYIRKKLELLGFAVDIRNVYKGAYHCYIKFPGMLIESGLSGHRDEKILIRINTEGQHFEFIPQKKILNKFDVFTEVFSTPPQILLAQKFYAILNRPRNKGRDFYDVVFLLGRGVAPDYSYLNTKLAITNSRELKQAMNQKLSQIDMKEMAKDVSIFLFDPKSEIKVLRFKEYFRDYEW